MAETTIDAVAPSARAVAVDKPPGYWITVARRIRRDPVTLFCLVVLSLIVLAAIFAPFVAPHDPYKTSMLRRLAPMGTPGHLLGTDELGRDLLTHLIYGGRISLFMSFTPVVLAFSSAARSAHDGGVRRRLGQHGDHAHDRRVLRLPSSCSPSPSRAPWGPGSSAA
jgi:ABC-type antimicrobial peptide transport system permease subunit